MGPLLCCLKGIQVHCQVTAIFLLDLPSPSIVTKGTGSLERNIYVGV